MDQKKPRPLYRSKGAPAKVTNLYKILGIFLAAVGALLLFLPLFSDAPWSFVLLGLVYLAVAFLCPRFCGQMKRCRLYVFNDQIAGVAAYRMPAGSNNPFSGRKAANADVKFKFYLDEITNVEKAFALFSQLSITANGQTYTLVVKDRDRAYDLLCDMIFGSQGARECVACGAPIGSTTEKCAQCGQMTRYGHSLSEAKTDNKNYNILKVNNIIALVIGIVGLIILLPALGDYENIRTYGQLYVALYPAESKKIMMKLLIGGLMVCYAVISPVVDILIKKLLKR